MKNLKRTLRDNVWMRWVMLLMVGFVLAANYYFYDALSPLKTIFEKEFGFTSTHYGLFVSVYSLSNVFLCMAVVGGIVLDKLGIRRTGFMFVSFMAFGALVTAYGASDIYSNGGWGYGFMSSFLPNYSPQLKMMLLGRFLFGLGAETSIVVISKIIVKWFKGKELALAFGVKLGLARTGSFLAFQLSPYLIKSPSGWTTAIWFAALFVTISLLVFMIYMMFDLKLDRQSQQDGIAEKSDPFKFSDLKELIFNRSFMYVTLLCLTFYSAVFPFFSFSADFFLNKFNLSISDSSDISSMLPVGTMIFTPLFGFIVDKYGRAATLMIYGSLILVFVHTCFAFTTINPYVLMVVLGIAFSLVPASMWPSVAKIVDEKRIGTAYGFMFSVQNIGLWIFPILAGLVLDKTNAPGAESLNYTYTMIMFASLGILGLIFAILLKREDKVSGYGLDLPSNAK
ncbi:MFS transporter [Ancylomarina sp. 16SWW S1-10-2]|uniref:MFS transporter n=1 Tax=Ancylomarina sp. 16SWW S1-10-2 TaxID=2499681 RepID=UPI0012AD8DD1|nr:MFS transporter [Ancylomarina sp. 16SWW S1-10-2]MRT93487.1 MFS transporter [Ancylomarina sp. 16SWW S1-10-2]